MPSSTSPDAATFGGEAGRHLAQLEGERAGAEPPEEAGPTARLVWLNRCGKYEAVLREPLAVQLLLPEDPACEGAAERTREFLTLAAGADDTAVEAVLALGCACLCLFAQVNWIGAKVDEAECHLGQPKEPRALEALQADGEPVYALLVAPRLLCAARALLIDCLPATTASQPRGFAASWWAARCAVLHQRCLAGRAPSLDRLATKAMRDAITALEGLTRADTGGAGAGGDGGDGGGFESLLGGAAAAALGGTAGTARLARGQRVLVAGLEGRPELNGRAGVVKKYDEAKSRYAVAVEGGKEPMLLKPECLVAAADGEGEGGAAAELVGAMTAEQARALPPDARRALSLAHLELVHALLLGGQGAAAELALSSAKMALGLQTRLEGALGKRTKHQEHAVSQLVLTTTLLPHALPRDAEAQVAESELPEHVVEENEDLLDELDLSAGGEAAAGADRARHLGPLEQAAVLSECALLRACRPAHESTNEEVEPYVRAALARPRCWAAQTHALRVKARLEGCKTRRRHQSLMQLQALVDDLRPKVPEIESLLGRHKGVVATEGQPTAPAADGTAAATAAAAAAEGPRRAWRMRSFWGVPLAPRWQLESELARTLAAIGLLTEASNLFEELELWDEFVVAMLQMGARDKAEAAVRGRLDASPTPAMWCHLGDLVREPAHYQTGWELSGGSCARAKLALGSAAMKEERWEEARGHLLEALAVKVHFAEAWYCAAICSLKLEKTDEAMKELRRVVSLEPQHYQAWSSLGGLFSKARMKREALFAFREASKLRGDSWQLWQHVALSALDNFSIDEALFAATRSLETGGAPLPQISSLVCQAVAQDVKCYDDRTAGRLYPKAKVLIETSCRKKPEEQTHWASLLHLETKCGSRAGVRAALTLQVEELRRATNWKTDPDSLHAFAEVVAQLVEAKLEHNELEEVREVRKLVVQLEFEAREKLEASEGGEELRMLLARLKRHMDDDD